MLLPGVRPLPATATTTHHWSIYQLFITLHKTPRVTYWCRRGVCYGVNDITPWHHAKMLYWLLVQPRNCQVLCSVGTSGLSLPKGEGQTPPPNWCRMATMPLTLTHLVESFFSIPNFNSYILTKYVNKTRVRPATSVRNKRVGWNRDVIELWTIISFCALNGIVR